MKRVTKFLALMLAVVLTVGCLAACGKKTNGNKGGTGKTDIEISVVHSGAGLAWLDDLIAAFKEKYPEYNVYYNSSSSHATVTASYGYEDIDTVDLYIAGKMYDTKYLEPLNDVLESTVEGESKTIKEKFNETYLKQKELNGNYYQLATSNGGSIVGLVYNKELFKEAKIKQLPRTTDELVVTAGMLYKMFVKTLGENCSWGVNGGLIQPGTITVCGMRTENGQVRYFVEKAEVLEDTVDEGFFGAYGVVQMPNLQTKLRHMAEEGFRHHSVITIGDQTRRIREALSKYLGYTEVEL